MPEVPLLTHAKIDEIDAFYRAKGMGSLLQNDRHALQTFVDRAADPETKKKNRAMLDAAFVALANRKGLGKPDAPEGPILYAPPAPSAVEVGPNKPPERMPYKGTFAGGQKGIVGDIGNALGSFMAGGNDIATPVMHLLGFKDDPALMAEFEDIAARSRKESPKAATTGRIVGNVLPFFAIPGGAVATPARAAATGAVTGALTTEGGLKERALGALGSAAAFGIGAKAKAALAPFYQRLLGYGLDPSRAQMLAARLAPHVIGPTIDAGTFTAIGALEQEFRPGEKIPLADRFLANLGTMAVAHGMGLGLTPRMSGAERKGQAAALKDTFAQEPGPVSMHAAMQAMEGVADPYLATIAYRTALKGTDLAKLPPEQIRAFVRGGPEALRALAPEAAKDLFAKEFPAEPAPAPTRGVAEIQTEMDAIAAERKAKGIKAVEFADSPEGQRWMQLQGERDALLGKPVAPDNVAAEDAVSNVLPPDSKGMKLLGSGNTEQVTNTLKRLADADSMPPPGADLKIDTATPEGRDAARRALAEIPPSSPGFPDARAASEPPPFTGDIKAPFWHDWLRGSWRVFPKILGPETGQRMHEKFLEADYKTRWMQHLARKSLAATAKKYDAWLKTLDPLQQAEARIRMVDLAETPPSTGTAAIPGAPVLLGTHPVETEMLTKVKTLFGRYARMLEASRGKPIGRFKGRYFPHIFDEISVSDDAAAKRIADRIMAEWKGRGQTSSGSAFLRERTTQRTDFARDLFFVMDAYINSATKAIYWKPVVDEIKGMTKPGGAFSQYLARKITESKGNVGEIRAATKRMERAHEFLLNRAEAGMGRRESRLSDAIDEKLVPILKKLGYEPTRSPIRSLIHGYVYAQYVQGLGLNIGSAVRNLTQQVNTVSEVGPEWWGKAMKTIAADLADGKHGINRILRRGHVMSASWTQDIQRSVETGIGASLKRGIGKASDIAMLPFTAAEFMNRATAYLAGYYKAIDQGLPEARARAYGREIVSRTQFDYGPGLGGRVYDGPFSHALFQFTRFPIYQTDYLASVFGRAVSGDTRTMLPQDRAIAPALRLAAASLVASPLFAMIGMDFNDDYGIGGQPEVLKLAETKGLEAIGRTGLLGGPKGYEGEVRGRHIARALGIEPYERTLEGALGRAFGPAARQSLDVLDMLMGDDRERHVAGKVFWQDARTLFPGLAYHRFERFMREWSEQKVRNSRTGEVMFPLSKWDAAARLAGINTSDTIAGYEAIRDTKARQSADVQMRSNLYDDVREFYRQLKDAKDPDAGPKAFAKFAAGLKEIYTETAVEHRDLYTGKGMREAFKSNVIERYGMGERTTEQQRLQRKSPINRSRILGPEGGR